MYECRLAGQFLPPVDTPPTEPTTTWRLPEILLASFKQIGANSDAEGLAAGVTETLAAALSHFEEFELIDPGGASGVIAAVGGTEAVVQTLSTQQLCAVIQDYQVPGSKTR